MLQIDHRLLADADDALLGVREVEDRYDNDGQQARQEQGGKGGAFALGA